MGAGEELEVGRDALEHERAGSSEGSKNELSLTFLGVQIWHQEKRTAWLDQAKFHLVPSSSSNNSLPDIWRNLRRGTALGVGSSYGRGKPNKPSLSLLEACLGCHGGWWGLKASQLGTV